MWATMGMYEEIRMLCGERATECGSCRRVLGLCEKRMGEYIDIVVLDIIYDPKAMYLVFSRQI